MLADLKLALCPGKDVRKPEQMSLQGSVMYGQWWHCIVISKFTLAEDHVSLAAVFHDQANSNLQWLYLQF